MKTNFAATSRVRSITKAAVLAALVAFAGAAHAQQPLGTAFTYQGELASAGAPATGTYDIRFRLYDAASGGSQIGSTLCSDNLAVSAGRFGASLDFGGVFTGQKRFLEIEVRQDAGLDCSDASGYTVLSPRQELTAAPNATYSLTASNATSAASLNGQPASFFTNAGNLTGTLADGQLSSNVARLNGNQTFTGQTTFSNPANTFSGIFSGSGAGLTNLSGGSINAGTLARSSLSADVQSGVGTVALDLSLAGSVATGSSPTSVAVSGSFAYVVNYFSNTLQVFNISNPAAPMLAGSVATGSGPWSVAVSGSFAYVVNTTSNSLQVFNISNPAAPTLAGSVATGATPFSVAVSGAFAYVVNASSNTLQVFNISNSAAPMLAGNVATGSGPRSVAVSGSFAYVVNTTSNSLQVFNVSNPAAPTLAGSVATGNVPFSVAVSGSLAYVVSRNSDTLQVFNISNPAAPTLAGSVGTGSQPYSVAVSDSFAYVVNQSSNTLQLFNISNPAAPTLAGSVATGSQPYFVAGSGSLAYVVNQSSNTLQVFNAAIGIGFGTPLTASSLAGVNGSGLTNVNAASLNGKPESFFTNASNITTGSFDAAKIASGTLTAARIPDLDAAKLTTGTLADGRLSSNIPRLDANNGFSGNTGLGVATPAARLHVGDPGFSGTLRLDQSQQRCLTCSNKPGWQSFTAGLTGQLAAVEFAAFADGLPFTYTLRVYSGTGTGGTLLYTGSISQADTTGLVNHRIPQGQRPSVASGGTYTFSIDSLTLIPQGGAANPYAGGRQTDALWDWVFSTYVVQDAVAPVDTLVANNQGLVGIGTITPTNRLSVAGNADFTGNVGIGTAAPGVPLSIRTGTNVVGMAHSDGTVSLATRMTPTIGTIGTISSHALGLFSNGQPASVFVSPNGYLGIGVSNPSTQFACIGNASVSGSLSKGGGSFKIDHPLDPENKYLYHSFVESPDMMNIYNGNVTTDGQGYATITLPDYFEALNRDFRYTLTVIDEDAPDVHFVRVARKISGNQFTIRSTPGNLEVSWQVTGIRQDAWAQKNRIPNSVDKPVAEKGKLLHPEAFGKSAEQGIMATPAGTAAPANK